VFYVTLVNTNHQALHAAIPVTTLEIHAVLKLQKLALAKVLFAYQELICHLELSVKIVFIMEKIVARPRPVETNKLVAVQDDQEEVIPLIAPTVIMIVQIAANHL
jgi:hypothetical protein